MALECAAVIYKLRKNGSAATGWGVNPGQGLTRIYNGNPGRGASGLFVKDMSVDQRGRILIAGSSQHGRRRSGGFLIRLTANGKVDRSFLGGARVRTRVRGMVELISKGNHDSSIASIRTLPSGRILAGGFLNGRFMVARFLSSGSLDRSFGNEGVRTVDVDGQRNCECSHGLALSRDRHGRVLLAGSAGTVFRDDVAAGSYSPVVIRLTATGRLDWRFGKRGIARFNLKKTWASSLALQRNGQILLSGDRFPGSYVMRLNTNGTVDRGFFDSGKLGFDNLGAANDLIVDSRGRIVIAGGSPAGGVQVTRLFPR